MRKSLGKVDYFPSLSEAIPPMLNGVFNPAFFKFIQATYEDKTGYRLVLSDPNGSIQMGLPDCDKFPCMQSCRECRERIVSEALRTGKVCIDDCHEGYTIWGLPFAHDGKVVGGLIVIGGERKSNQDDDRFHRACAELYQLMSEHGLLPDPGVLDEVDLSRIHRFVYRSGFDALNAALAPHRRAFLAHLQTLELDEARIAYGHIRDAFANAGNLPMDVVRGLAGDLVYEAKRECIQFGMDPYACTAESGEILDRLSGLKSADQLPEVLDFFFERFNMLSNKRPKDADDLLVEKATTYLEEHLRENLTRESVARAVGISPSHFSRLIREKKGRTFTDLLNQYRIERAAKLLIRTSDTLAHVATETGFCDQSYFSKVFRRYKDVTPAQYRDSHKA